MRRFLFIIALLFIASPVQAQGLESMENSGEPIEITAEQALEWDRQNRLYIATGDVIITQGEVTLNADKVVAEYADDGNGGNIDLTILTATGNVIIRNTDSTVTGDQAVYDVRTGQAVVTGDNLALTTPQQVVKAKESLEYNTVTGEAKAVGDAQVVSGTDTLAAQSITAFFQKDEATGQQSLNRAQAEGGVKITTPEETITGNSGTYDAPANTATITGNVKIVRGPNTLEGNRATVNLATNVSQLFGGGSMDTRVKGVFFPEQTNTPNSPASGS
jgi:lipopolysaccharide export system protein LptA